METSSLPPTTPILNEMAAEKRSTAPLEGLFSPPNAQTVKTFEDAVAFVDRSYPRATARMLKSSLRQIAWSLMLIEARRSDRHPDPDRKALQLRHLPFDLPLINRALEGVSFRLAGHDSEKTFRNAKSALRRVGRDLFMVAPHRAPELPPDTPYAPLLSVASSFEQASARRFAARMTEEGRHPADLTNDDLQRYADFLSNEMVGIRVAPMLRRIVRLWRLTASRYPDWPQHPLSLPPKKVPSNPPFAAYPLSLQAEIEELRRRLEGSNRQGPFSPNCDRPPLRPETVKLRLSCIRTILGAYVALGNEPESVTGFADLLGSPKVIENILQALWDRGQERRRALPECEQEPNWNGNTGQLDAVGVTLIILLDYFPPPPAAADRIRWLVKRVRMAPMRGMSKRNRNRLEQFRDPTKLGALLNLPNHLMAMALKLRNQQADEAARLARASVIFGIELKIPLRMKNLHTLRIGHNLRFTNARSETATLSFQAYEMKNHQDVEFYVGSRLCRLLKTYIDYFWKSFADTSPDAAEKQWLFPAGRKQPGPLSPNQISKIIKDTMAEYVGAEFHPHLFRALAVELGLQRDPSGHEHFRQLLGHRSLQTVLTHYTPIRTKQAAAYQDRLVDEEADRLTTATAPFKGHRGRRTSS